MFLAGTIVLLLGVLTVIGTFISDLLLMWIEPRIRQQVALRHGWLHLTRLVRTAVAAAPTPRNASRSRPNSSSPGGASGGTSSRSSSLRRRGRCSIWSRCSPISSPRTDPHATDARRSYIPPQAIHLFDDDGASRPHVSGLQGRARSAHLQAGLHAGPEPQGLPARCSRRAIRYNLFGLFPTDRHLLGLDGRASREDGLFLLGTDLLGRDLWSRLHRGDARSRSSIGLAGVAISLLLGVLLGGVSGLYGGSIDTVIQRVIEIMRSIPTIPLWMGLAAALPNTWSVTQVYFAITLIISLIGWTDLARVVRGRFLALREEDFVIAAELAGAEQMRIIFRHMLPSFLEPHHRRDVSLALPAMIISETSLSFLGLGLRPPAISWGILLQDAQNMQALARRALAAGRGGAGHRRHPGLQLPRRRAARCRRPLWLKHDAPRRHAHPLGARPETLFRLRTRASCARSTASSFDLHPGRTLGIVGESGCGKSVTARAILRIVDRPGPIVGGEIWLDRADGGTRSISRRSTRERGRCARSAASEIGLIFQEPMTSLSVHYTVGNQIIEAIRLHTRRAQDEARAARDRAAAHGRHPAAGAPHRRLSVPAQRRPAPARDDRAGARLRSAHPDRRRADHRARRHDAGADPRLLRRLQRAAGLALILITHDMGVIAEMADDVAVMYLGRMVENGPVDADLPRAAASLHPRAAALGPDILAVPRARLATIGGAVPHPYTARSAARSIRAARRSSRTLRPRSARRFAGRASGRELLPLPSDAGAAEAALAA